MRLDVSGWMTRLDEDMVSRYEASGQWTGMTLARCARDMAERSGDLSAVVDGDLTLSFRQLFVQGVRLASAMRRRGLQQGDVISFQLPNWHEAMAINLAACLGGFIANPIVPIYRDSEVAYILRHSRTKALFIPSVFRSINYLEMVDRLRPNLPDLREVALVRTTLSAQGCSFYEEWLAEESASIDVVLLSFPKVDPNSVKLLLYTSGTTGEPKGVLHSHNTIRAEMDAVIKFWGLTGADVVLMPSPVTHITGYLYALELCFAAGMKAVLMERWNAVDAVQLIRTHGASFTLAATPFLLELGNEVERQKAQLPSLRLFGCGGAPVPHALVERAKSALPNCLIFRVYGSSEAPTVSLGVAQGDPEVLGGTTDGVVFNHEVRIVDPVSGVLVPVVQEGEILTRGPEVMLGYTKPEHTEDAFDAEGYFHTGDLGFLDARGYITISGRKKDLIIRGGENISPKEIEDVLHQHPAVLEAAVIAMPHARLGETPCACVVLRPGHSLDLVSLIGFLDAAKLARQKFPERLLVLAELPHTASGKVLKHVLRDRVAFEEGNQREVGSAVAGERLLHLYSRMLLIRTVESMLAKVFAEGEVPGFIHLSNGQEAVAVGVALGLNQDDTLAATHRGHGHVLAKGLDLEGFFKEILGKDGGVCRGRGGSMHVSDMRLGIIGANGIVGAGIPIALGSALAMRTRGTQDVAVAFFGDGAMAEGVLHESMNFAALLKLPLLLVCENNGWSEFSPTDRQFAASLSGLAKAFSIQYETVDGNDVLAVADAADGAIRALRAGAGPAILECHTHRARGHFEGDAQLYRPTEDAGPDTARDPLARANTALRAAGVGAGELQALRESVEARVSAALKAARADVAPDFEAAFNDVYTMAGS